MFLKFLDIDSLQLVGDRAEIIDAPDVRVVYVLDDGVADGAFIFPVSGVEVEVGSVGRVRLAFDFVSLAVQGVDVRVCVKMRVT